MPGVQSQFPVIYDTLSGEKTKRPLDKPFGSLEKMESLSAAERWISGRTSSANASVATLAAQPARCVIVTSA